MRQGAPTRVAQLARHAVSTRPSAPDSPRIHPESPLDRPRGGAAHRPSARATLDRAARHSRVACGVATRGRPRGAVRLGAALRRSATARRDRRPPAAGARRGLRGRRHRRHGRHERGRLARRDDAEEHVGPRRRRSRWSIPATRRRGASSSTAGCASPRCRSTATASRSSTCVGCRGPPMPSWSRRATSTRSAADCRSPPVSRCSTGPATSARS